ncbi:MAG TPA: methyltransferase domain-containing protein [Pseudonocardiaceae bacterium]|nr:methyltransferase domain-containing protein [Pseudonocardiaceae bacterium]
MTQPPPTTLVGDGIAVQGSQWSFGGDTAEHFDEHVSRSVPGYHDGHALVAQLSDFFVRDGSRVIEVGCSTAALTELLATRHTSVSATFHGVDIAPEMVIQARRRCVELTTVNIELADAQRIDYTGSTFVVMYYTLQFVPPDRRLELLRRIYAEIRPGGGIVVFEKTLSPDARLQDLFNQIYEEFKLGAGFTPEDILNKSRSLRGVLEPLTGEQNLALLRTAGFTDSWLIHKHLAFEGLLGVKPVL